MDLEQLRAACGEKCREALELRAEIQRSDFEKEHLRVRLAALGVQDQSMIPTHLRCGGRQAEDPNSSAIKSMVEWLAQSRDVQAQQPTIFEVGGEIDVGGRKVFLGRMVSWPLKGDAGLKLSVPQDLEAELLGLLARAERDLLDQAVLQQLTASWEMLGADVATEGDTRPAIFMVHRETSQAIVVAAWPTMQVEAAPTFNPDQYFSTLLVQDPAPAQSSFAAVGPPESPPAALLPPALPEPPPCLARGERVEIQFEGRWLTGVLASIEGDAAHVVCDSDSPGVLTIAPLSGIRPTNDRRASAGGLRPRLGSLQRSRSLGCLPLA